MIRRHLAAAALTAAAVTAPALPAAADEAKTLVTLITAAEPQSQLMGMVLTMAAMQQGATAHVLLCGPAGDIALREAPETATAPQPPRGASPQGLMQAIMAEGATVEVCAIYLPGRGEGPEVLIDGVSVAQPPAMAARLLAEDARILSF